MPELSQFEKDGEVYDLKDTFAREELVGKLPASWAEWRVIADVTTESEIENATFDKDINGESFELREVVVFLKVLPNEAETTSSYFRVFLNNINIYQPNGGVPSTDYRWSQCYVSLVGGSWINISRMQSVNTSVNFAGGYNGSIADIQSGQIYTHTPATAVRVSFLTNAGVGSRIIILGR